MVCSTHVEMFPNPCPADRRRTCLLHACGDVSVPEFETWGPLGFAPRMWRCFHRRRHGQDAGWVCSTHVEMFLST